MRVAALLFFVGAALADFSEVERIQEQRIIGGTVTTINQYPHAVALLRSSTGSGTFTQACGGSILNRFFVLSAAHCFNSQPFANQWRTRVGSTNAHSGGSLYNTQFITRHPDYVISTAESDVAILRIVGTFIYSNAVQAVSIAGANYNVADNQVVWAIGWGNTVTSGWPVPSEQLRHVQIWTINQAICRQRYATRNLLVTDNMLCSGWLDVGGRDQCQGDSGGPLYHNNVQVGVCSWGLGCADPFFPGVNARVSRFAQWIVATAT